MRTLLNPVPSLHQRNQRDDEEELRSYRRRLGGDLRRGGDLLLNGGDLGRGDQPRLRGIGPLNGDLGLIIGRAGRPIFKTGAAVISCPSICPPSMFFIAVSASSAFVYST